MDLGTTMLRGTIGTLFMGHGAQKLWGMFGGHGIEGTGGFFESLGLRPGERHARAAGVAEFGGGLLLALGALTPLASTVISSAMITAIRKAHIKQGPWAAEGGYEYNLVLIAACTALAEVGPGRPSVDAARFPGLHGTGWAIASLLAATAGSFAATASGDDGEGPREGEQPVPGDPAATADAGRFARDEAGAPTGGTNATSTTA
jgi:putative oxidoreductase